VGETAAILSEAKVECGGGRNATAANSLKIPVTETRKWRSNNYPLNTYKKSA
jgi:hypothetical protein